jgi:predicted DNA-binding transcriptional regulator YafY
MKKVFEYVDLIARFHALVMSRTTGNPEYFAARLGISRSSLYNLIEELQSYGIDIEYSRFRQTFFYTCPDRVEITISICQHEV